MWLGLVTTLTFLNLDRSGRQYVPSPLAAGSRPEREELMQVKSGWRTGALLVAALLAGSIVGAPLVHAPTADLVTIQGSDSTHQVAVTQAGQLEETSIAPGSEVTVFQFPSCA